ncbi:unnamed protein product [Cyprideis torosa]|uniref:Uncharacterized protein n=1 Tax=Cyprideis torosa TaxID=163714 RepID=A0A7R8ZM66_9CRUS|nr:unnamed protein product [Cyprideis torosa]CAG0893500.1 unnamed protein product [Cyprideis torosa]
MGIVGSNIIEESIDSNLQNRSPSPFPEKNPVVEETPPKVRWQPEHLSSDESSEENEILITQSSTRNEVFQVPPQGFRKSRDLLSSDRAYIRVYDPKKKTFDFQVLKPESLLTVSQPPAMYRRDYDPHTDEYVYTRISDPSDTRRDATTYKPRTKLSPRSLDLPQVAPLEDVPKTLYARKFNEQTQEHEFIPATSLDMMTGVVFDRRYDPETDEFLYSPTKPGREYFDKDAPMYVRRFNRETEDYEFVPLDGSSESGSGEGEPIFRKTYDESTDEYVYTEMTPQTDPQLKDRLKQLTKDTMETMPRSLKDKVEQGANKLKEQLGFAEKPNEVFYRNDQGRFQKLPEDTKDPSKFGPLYSKEWNPNKGRFEFMPSVLIEPVPPETETTRHPPTHQGVQPPTDFQGTFPSSTDSSFSHRSPLSSPPRSPASPSEPIHFPGERRPGVKVKKVPLFTRQYNPLTGDFQYYPAERNNADQELFKKEYDPVTRSFKYNPTERGVEDGINRLDEPALFIRKFDPNTHSMQFTPVRSATDLQQSVFTREYDPTNDAYIYQPANLQSPTTPHPQSPLSSSDPYGQSLSDPYGQTLNPHQPANPGFPSSSLYPQTPNQLSPNDPNQQPFNQAFPSSLYPQTPTLNELSPNYPYRQTPNSQQPPNQGFPSSSPYPQTPTSNQLLPHDPYRQTANSQQPSNQRFPPSSLYPQTPNQLSPNDPYGQTSYPQQPANQGFPSSLYPQTPTSNQLSPNDPYGQSSYPQQPQDQVPPSIMLPPDPVSNQLSSSDPYGDSSNPQQVFTNPPSEFRHPSGLRSTHSSTAPDFRLPREQDRSHVIPQFRDRTAGIPGVDPITGQPTYRMKPEPRTGTTETSAYDPNETLYRRTYDPYNDEYIYTETKPSDTKEPLFSRYYNPESQRYEFKPAQLPALSSANLDNSPYYVKHTDPRTELVSYKPVKPTEISSVKEPVVTRYFNPETNRFEILQGAQPLPSSQAPLYERIYDPERQTFTYAKLDPSVPSPGDSEIFTKPKDSSSNREQDYIPVPADQVPNRINKLSLPERTQEHEPVFKRTYDPNTDEYIYTQVNPMEPLYQRVVDPVNNSFTFQPVKAHEEETPKTPTKSIRQPAQGFRRQPAQGSPRSNLQRTPISAFATPRRTPGQFGDPVQPWTGPPAGTIPVSSDQNYVVTGIDPLTGRPIFSLQQPPQDANQNVQYDPELPVKLKTINTYADPLIEPYVYVEPELPTEPSPIFKRIYNPTEDRLEFQLADLPELSSALLRPSPYYAKVTDPKTQITTYKQIDHAKVNDVTDPIFTRVWNPNRNEYELYRGIQKPEQNKQKFYDKIFDPQTSTYTYAEIDPRAPPPSDRRKPVYIKVGSKSDGDQYVPMSMSQTGLPLQPTSDDNTSEDLFTREYDPDGGQYIYKQLPPTEPLYQRVYSTIKRAHTHRTVQGPNPLKLDSRIVNSEDVKRKPTTDAPLYDPNAASLITSEGTATRNPYHFDVTILRFPKDERRIRPGTFQDRQNFESAVGTNPEGFATYPGGHGFRGNRDGTSFNWNHENHHRAQPHHGLQSSARPYQGDVYQGSSPTNLPLEIQPGFTSTNLAIENPYDRGIYQQGSPVNPQRPAPQRQYPSASNQGQSVRNPYQDSGITYNGARGTNPYQGTGSFEQPHRGSPGFVQDQSSVNAGKYRNNNKDSSDSGEQDQGSDSEEEKGFRRRYGSNTGGGGSKPSVKCPQAAGVFPHPYDCTKFLNCAHGHPFVTDCPAGLRFDPRVSVCNWPSAVPCNNE